MKNWSTLGIPTCAIFSVFLTGTSFKASQADTLRSSAEDAWVVNNSNSIVYYKPESKEANPGLKVDGVYKIAPGEALYAPVDAIVTSTTEAGRMYRVPTGGKVIVDKNGVPKPANLIAKGGTLLPRYGNVESPYHSFAKLVNSKHVLYHLPDITIATTF